MTDRMQVAQRANVPPFHVMDLLAAAQRRQLTHGDLVNFVAGQPSTGAPKAVREEAKRLLDEEVLGYTVATGVPGLREAVAAHHRRTSGIDVSLDDVVITTGSSGGFLLAFLAAFEPGDRVVMARPGYACYRNVLTALGLRGRRDRLRPRDPLPADGRAARRGRGAWSTASSSPRPPTPPARWCRPTSWPRSRAGARTTWSGWSATRSTTASPTAWPTSSAWQTSRTGVVFGSFSKYFSMTGWRLGWMLVPEDLRRPVDVLTGNFTICPPVLSQYAAIAAFTPESYAELDGHVARYATNRALLLDGLPRLGIDRLAPADGAFYVYADIGHLTDDSYAWCLRLLDETGVATAPGIDFDTRRGNEFVRLSFAGSAEEITEGLDRLGDWLG